MNVSKKYLEYLMACSFLLLLSYIFLFDLDINKFNFWMDYDGILDIDGNFFKHLYSWRINALGSFNFSSFSSLPFYCYLKIVFMLFGIKYGTYLTFYFLVFFTLLSGYLLLQSFLKNTKKSLLIVPLFVFNPLFLYDLFNKGTVTFLLGIIGLNLSFLFLNKYIETNKKTYFVLIIFSSLLISHPFLFTFFIFLFFYLFVVNKKYKLSILFVVLTILLHSFWIIPFLSFSLFVGANNLLGSYTTDLIGTYSTLSPLQNSFVFLGRSYHSFFTQFFKSSYSVSIIVFLLFTFWLYIIYISLIKKKREKRYIFYWIFILFLLIFSIGSRGELGIIYKYLFEHLSFFSLFRSSQNVLIILFYFLMYFAISLAKKNNGFMKYLQVFSIILLCSFIFFRNTNFTSKSVSIPEEYFTIKNIVDNDKTVNRIFLLPLSTYDYYKWDISTQDKYFLQSFFKQKGLVFYRPTIDNFYLKNLYENLYKNEINCNNLNQIGVKYILNRKDLIYKDKGYYKDFTNKINLEKLVSSNNVELYKINSPEPFLSSSNLTFQMSNSVKYKVYIKNIKEKQNLSFLESFHNNWRLYVKPNPTNSWCEPIENYKVESKKSESFNITECGHTRKFFEGEELSYLYKKSVFDNTHKVVHKYANGWTINPEYIKQNYPKEYYKENPDGSIDVELVLYFKPQSYFYLGLIISGITLLGCVGYLGYDWRRGRKEKVKSL